MWPLDLRSFQQTRVPIQLQMVHDGEMTMECQSKTSLNCGTSYSACSENKLNEDMSECQKNCQSSICCFESGEYSSEEDEFKDCAVYAGCEALVEGALMEAAEEDEE